VPNSKLIDAPPHNIKLHEIVAQANDFDLDHRRLGHRAGGVDRDLGADQAGDQPRVGGLHRLGAVVQVRREDHRGDEGRQPAADRRPDRRQGRGP
jgi:hypothetical protein